MIHSESGVERERELTPAQRAEGERLRAEVLEAVTLTRDRRHALEEWIRERDREGVSHGELARATKLTRGRVWQIVERRR